MVNFLCLSCCLYRRGNLFLKYQIVSSTHKSLINLIYTTDSKVGEKDVSSYLKSIFGGILFKSTTFWTTIITLLNIQLRLSQRRGLSKLKSLLTNNNFQNKSLVKNINAWKDPGKTSIWTYTTKRRRLYKERAIDETNFWNLYRCKVLSTLLKTNIDIYTHPCVYTCIDIL